MVAMIADLPMRSPGSPGNAPLMMGREGAFLSHKAKRRLRSQPVEPLRGIQCESEPPLLWTDHHVASLSIPLDPWDDMDGLARRCGGSGSATRTGSRGCRWRGTLARRARLRRCRRAGSFCGVGLEEAAEISYLLLQARHLGLQGCQLLGQDQQSSRRRLLC